ncbi:hypothetical protein, partial [Microcoleus sp. B3-D3]|uniref:hypothetical protein n=1 Tax=Microcoleus sp. B3-D3 TaxID=2818656 RepID=UPI002FD053EA
ILHFILARALETFRDAICTRLFSKPYVERDIVFRIPQNGDRIHPAVASLLWSLLAVIVVSGLVGWINGAWKINKYRWFRRKPEPPRLPHSQSPPVNDMLQESVEVRSPTEQE